MTGRRWLTLMASIMLVGCRPAGLHQDAGQVTPKRVPEAVIAERSARQATSARAVDGAQKQILFGDLHVHTTFSADAFIASLPMLQGEGMHPPADACDFARFCSALDFWSINDHAENITPDHWRETKEAIRQCNAVAGDPKNPDLVSFLGWEWTQVGLTPDDHYGHKNVIFRETADTPQELFEKLAQWGFDSIVIPHGTTWGLYTPPGTTFDKQLAAAQQPEKQTLFEVYSGHGNSEEFRSWKAIDHDAEGNAVCPAQTRDYEACCWRAGDIIRSRCEGASAEECDERVKDARKNYLEAGVLGRQTVPGTSVEDWKDCGYCRDCFNPAYNMQPGNSAQYALAIRNFDDPLAPRGFTFGFIGSSDNHGAHPGTGFKEFARHGMTEAVGAREAAWRTRILGPDQPPLAKSVPFDRSAPRKLQTLQLLDFERQASFFMTGGLVAVHSDGRDRDAIWHALESREVYATSGDRILLWFDLLNDPSGPLPMGRATRLDVAPSFRVRAAGAFRQ